MLQYQAITCSPAYRNFSLEVSNSISLTCLVNQSDSCYRQELRLQDYSQNRKTASNSAFGTGSAFGSTQPAATNIFGSQTNQPAQAGVFGGGTTTTGTSGGFGPFGQQPNQSNAAQPGAGIFGGSSTFGQQPQQQQQQQPQQQQPNAFGAFGQQQQPQQQQPQQGGGIFGGGSTFGNTANKPAFGTTSAFGSSTYLLLP